jgi:hypothetical protein
MVFTGLLEIVRIPYFFLGRSFPSFVLLLFVTLLYGTAWGKRLHRLQAWRRATAMDARPA